ncbi:MAG TPA: IMP cyclohydrolase, partial [Desulfoprunum sp.]|nr:IMP cyclohydrolase [Desulfoprunum sp.]
ENIDIGGPTLLRASAKNFHDVTVIVDPADYPQVLAEITATGNTTLKTRFRLAVKVFDLTSRYDTAIAEWLNRIDIDRNAYFAGE